MLGKLFPVLLALAGVGAGAGAGLFLKPGAQEDGHAESHQAARSEHEEMPHAEDSAHGAEGALAHEYVKLNNQFVVPVVGDDRVNSLVVVSLSVEVRTGRREEVYLREPKLRDAFLQVLFDHANMGGFRGTFTNSNNMDVLRRALRETAHKVGGDLISDVLIVDINRQDV